MTLYERTRLLSRLADGVSKEPITLLLGPRQCGKTTLARYYEGRPDTHWFDLENYLHRSRLEDNLSSLANLRGLIVIDEVQILPQVFEYLRFLADRPDMPAKFILLGSASPKLVRHAAESLAGRVFQIEMHGFIGSEVGHHHQQTLWLRGGFPDSFICKSDADSIRWRRDFISAFLQRDLPSIAEVRLTAQQLRQLLVLLAAHNGSAVNASALGRDIGVDFKTVQRYLNVMEGAYILRVLPPYFINIPKRIRKTPKLYFRDTGILHALLNVETTEELETSGRMGFSWESFCLEHLIHEAQIPSDNCFYYSVQGGAEVDLVVSLKGALFGFEFKHGGKPEITRSMREAANDLKIKRLFQIYPGNESFPMDEQQQFWAVSWKDMRNVCSWM